MQAFAKITICSFLLIVTKGLAIEGKKKKKKHFNTQ